ncbi:hypothetical protein [Maridesulfovibrio sp.]|uniref:hypothetical protein n=1 Tax=Maridesulfovibrio sp. TaxID=2795000 RepID=UPI0029CA896F|nr:hypothetical protein [Maridesulfovibrio sp.]
MKRMILFLILGCLLVPATVHARAVYFCYCISPEYAGSNMEKSARTSIEEVVASRETEPMERSLHGDAERKFARLRQGGFTMDKLNKFSNEFGFGLFMGYDPHIEVKRTGSDGQMDIVTISLDVKAIDAQEGKIIGSKKASWTFTINKGIKKPANSPAVAKAMRATAKKLTEILADSETMMMWLLTH